MFKVISLTACLFILIQFPAYSQKQWNNWYFGNGIGIDFNGAQPVAVPHSAMYQMEGSASVSDAAGRLLFYTNGITVYNRNHRQMLNGAGLMGHASSTQSALIVPKPGDDNVYYIFTVAFRGDPASTGLRYSEVDMRLDGGQGAVTAKKNILLATGCYEKLAAVKHCNDRDVWVTTFQWPAANYISFLVSPGGIATASVNSGNGPGSMPVSSTVGYLRFSPDGRKMAAAFYELGLQVAAFDNKTGKMSNPVSYRYWELPTRYGTPYGVEFSPDCNSLYCSAPSSWGGGDMFSMDIRTFNRTTQLLSAQQVLPWDDYREVFSLCLGPDKKIYVAEKVTGTYTSVLGTPDNRSNPGYINRAILYSTGTSGLGLPNIIAGAYKSPRGLAEIAVKASCSDTKADYSCTDLSGVDSVHWHLGEGDTLRAPSGTFTYSREGRFSVALIRYYPCYSDTTLRDVEIKIPRLHLGNDTALCVREPLVLKGDQAAAGYLWSDGTTAPELPVSQSGTYWLEITDAKGCRVRDNIDVLFKPYPALKAPSDTFLCDNQPVLLNVSVGRPDAVYYLQDVIAGPVMQITRPGVYHVKVSVEGCDTSGSFRVVQDTLPRFSLGGKMGLCDGDQIVLDKSVHQFDEYTWQDGSHSPVYKVVKPGQYYLRTTNRCGSVSDTLIVSRKDCEGRFQLPTAFTPNHDGKNDIFRPQYAGTVKGYVLQVFSRWGNRVFVSNDPRTGWDGSFGGAPLPAGTYVWQLHYLTYQTNEQVTQTGTILLLR